MERLGAESTYPWVLRHRAWPPSAFLLFDELWVEADPVDILQVEALVQAEIEAAALGVMVPARLDPPPTRDELSNRRPAPLAEVPTPGMSVDRPGRSRVGTALGDDPASDP
jgi:hypothetical protein